MHKVDTEAILEIRTKILNVLCEYRRLHMSDADASASGASRQKSASATAEVEYSCGVAEDWLRDG